MSFTERLLVHIGRQALNPQPIPPKEPGGPVALNPQPIPPREYGVLVAREILRVHWYAGAVGIEPTLVSSWDEDPCPVGRKPKIPPHLPPIPDPDPGPEWSTEYLLGVASTLAAADDDGPFVSDALEHASRALGRALG